jgi:type IV/VI secretion system ImpK/VasF family protein
MPTPANRLWFPIERAFSSIEKECLRAYAAELALARRNRDPFDTKAAEPAIEPRFASAGRLADDPSIGEEFPEGADFVSLRSEIRKQLLGLRAALADVLTEREVYFALFPVVVYADELVRAVARAQVTRWEPLQSELYDVTDGGELFFTYLDQLLVKADTHPVVFEAFYFCLSDGFKGMYAGSPQRLDDIRERLALRIPKPTIELAPIGERPPIELAGSPWRYYAAAGAAVLATLLALWWSSPS